MRAHVLFEIAPRHVHGPGRLPEAAEQHSREAFAAQSILVVHRRLVHDVLQLLLVPLGAVAEEDHVLAAQDHDRRVFRTHVHDEPVAGRRRVPS